MGFNPFDPSPHLVTSHCALCLRVFAFRCASATPPSFAVAVSSAVTAASISATSLCLCNSFFHLWSNLRTAITLTLAISSALRRFLYSLVARNLCGRCSFLSFTAICCSSQNSKCLLRWAELESYQPRSFSSGLVLSIPTPSHIFLTASCNRCHRSNSTRPYRLKRAQCSCAASSNHLNSELSEISGQENRRNWIADTLQSEDQVPHYYVRALALTTPLHLANVLRKSDGYQNASYVWWM